MDSWKVAFKSAGEYVSSREEEKERTKAYGWKGERIKWHGLRCILLFHYLNRASADVLEYTLLRASPQPVLGLARIWRPYTLPPSIFTNDGNPEKVMELPVKRGGVCQCLTSPVGWVPYGWEMECSLKLVCYELTVHGCLCRSDIFIKRLCVEYTSDFSVKDHFHTHSTYSKLPTGYAP